MYQILKRNDSISGVLGHVEQGNQYQIHAIYEHNLQRSAFNFCYGPFGNIYGEFINLINSSLSNLHFFSTLSITSDNIVISVRHAGHCWRSRDELISYVLLWTPTYGRAKAGWPVRTYIQQLCEDMGCGSEDLPEAMNDREKWRERIRDICACSTTWWWWWLCCY